MKNKSFNAKSDYYLFSDKICTNNLSVHWLSDESRTYEDGSLSYAGYISNSEAPDPNTFFRELKKNIMSFYLCPKRMFLLTADYLGRYFVNANNYF